MRIVCPSCSAAYDLPDGALSPGRAVRCARCGTQWAPLAAKDGPAAAPAQPVPMLPATVGASPDAAPFADLGAALADDPGVEQSFPRSARPTSPRGSVLPIAAWILSFALLAVLIGAAYAWRAQIMASWPPSERLYAALGLAHPASRAISPQPQPQPQPER